MPKFLDYSNPTTIGQLDAAIREANADGICHYMAGSFARRLELTDIVAGIRGIGWPQIGIDVPTLATINGAVAGRRAVMDYGHHGLFVLDIEPDEFASNPQGWKVAADAWCEGVKSMPGLIPGVYGTDATVAACSDHADWIWRAKPGMCDPSGPGLDAAFFPSRRAVQCGRGSFAGLTCDVSFSNFPIGLPPITEVPVVSTLVSSASVSRSDGSRDVFVVFSDTSMRHLVWSPTHQLVVSEKLVGDWWSAEEPWWGTDGSLHAPGIAVDGTVWEDVWSASSGWNGPFKLGG